MEWRDQIVSDPTVSAGKPVVKGTRLTVDYLLALFAEGWTEQEVLDNYPKLSRENLQAVFAFAHECMVDEEYITLGKLG